MDSIYPGTFNFPKVKWGAKFDYEYIENYKVLQQAFEKNGVKRHIDVSAGHLGLSFWLIEKLIVFVIVLGR